MFESNLGIAIIVEQWNHQLHLRSTKCPVHLILLDFVILKFIEQYTHHEVLITLGLLCICVQGWSQCSWKWLFRHVRKSAKSDYSICRVCLHGATRTPTGWIFMKFLIWVAIEKFSRKFKFNWNFTRVTATLHAHVCTFMTISRWILLRMRNFSDKSCREDRNTHFVFNNSLFPPFENRAVYEMWKNTVERGRPQMTHAHCMLDT